MNIFHSLETHARRDPQKTAIVAGGRRISYGELLDDVNRLAGAMNQLELKKGDRVALLMLNCPEFITSFYASMKLGLITVSLNVMFKKEEADYVLQDSEPEVLIAQEMFLPLIRELDLVKKKALRVILINRDESPKEDMISFQSLLKETPGDLSTLDLGPNDQAVIAYTSGTTGFPKGVVHTHQNILSHLDGISGHLGIGSGDVILAVLPFFQLVAYLIHPGLTFHVGGSLVIQEKFEPQSFLDSVKAEKVTFFAGVPTIYQMVFTAPDELGADMSTVRFGLCAGSPLSLELRQQFEKKFHFRIVHCYGMTEISMIAACEDPAVPPKGISVGLVLPYLEVRIVRDDGLPAETGEVGEIQINAEKSLKCYWNKSRETEEAIREGWFLTGDMGRFDEEGHLYIVDRKKDMIIRGGFNVFPAEIEPVLMQDPRVQEASVIGIPHERLGEVPKAFVVLKPGETATSEELMALSRSKLANFKALEEVEFVNAEFFPRNALGKIVKPQLRAAMKKNS